MQSILNRAQFPNRHLINHDTVIFGLDDKSMESLGFHSKTETANGLVVEHILLPFLTATVSSVVGYKGVLAVKRNLEADGTALNWVYRQKSDFYLYGVSRTVFQFE